MGQQPLTPERLELGPSSTHGPESLGSAAGVEKEDLGKKGITIEEGTVIARTGSLGKVFLLAEGSPYFSVLLGPGMADEIYVYCDRSDKNWFLNDPNAGMTFRDSVQEVVSDARDSGLDERTFLLECYTRVFATEVLASIEGIFDPSRDTILAVCLRIPRVCPRGLQQYLERHLEVFGS